MGLPLFPQDAGKEEKIPKAHFWGCPETLQIRFLLFRGTVILPVDSSHDLLHYPTHRELPNTRAWGHSICPVPCHLSQCFCPTKLSQFPSKWDRDRKCSEQPGRLKPPTQSRKTVLTFRPQCFSQKQNHKQGAVRECL